jgi:hypothetical protein
MRWCGRPSGRWPCRDWDATPPAVRRADHGDFRRRAAAAAVRPPVGLVIRRQAYWLMLPCYALILWYAASGHKIRRWRWMGDAFEDSRIRRLGFGSLVDHGAAPAQAQAPAPARHLARWQPSCNCAGNCSATLYPAGAARTHAGAPDPGQPRQPALAVAGLVALPEFHGGRGDRCAAQPPDHRAGGRRPVSPASRPRLRRTGAGQALDIVYYHPNLVIKLSKAPAGPYLVYDAAPDTGTAIADFDLLPVTRPEQVERGASGARPLTTPLTPTAATPAPTCCRLPRCRRSSRHRCTCNQAPACCN